MYGAILGDIIGSPFEFDRGDKTKEFDLFSRVCGFTDDSVMRVSAAGWLYPTIERTREIAEAITAFLEAESFEDAVRNAVSLGGDTDTVDAITGSIAEAYFGIPAVLKAECRNRIDPEMNRELDAFDEVLERNCRQPAEWMQGMNKLKRKFRLLICLILQAGVTK